MLVMFEVDTQTELVNLQLLHRHKLSRVDKIFIIIFCMSFKYILCVFRISFVSLKFFYPFLL